MRPEDSPMFSGVAREKRVKKQKERYESILRSRGVETPGMKAEREAKEQQEYEQEKASHERWKRSIDRFIM